MDIFYKILDYIIPVIAGFVILIFAIMGYPKAKSTGTEKKNIILIVLGCGLILASILFILCG